MEHFPCQNQDNCPQQQYKRGCYEDVHHLFHPASDYRTKVEQEFRELDANKELTCRQRHNDRHATEPIPEKPSRAEMVSAIALNALMPRGAAA